MPIVHVTAQALLPSTSVISFTLGNGLSFTTFVNTVPISGNRTVNRFALVRNLAIDKTGIFNMGAWDRFARQAMVKYAPARTSCGLRKFKQYLQSSTKFIVYMMSFALTEFSWDRIVLGMGRITTTANAPALQIAAAQRM